MRRDRMFSRKPRSEGRKYHETSEGWPKSPVGTRQKVKDFREISSRLSIALQETKDTLKSDVQKAVPRHRFMSGDSFWYEPDLYPGQREPPASPDLSHVPWSILTEDLVGSSCENVSDERLSEQEELEGFLKKQTHKFGWFEHVELYLERAHLIPKDDPAPDAATNCSQSLSENSNRIAPLIMEQSSSKEKLPEKVEEPPSATELSFTFSASSMEVDAVAEAVHELIEQLSDEMFSPVSSPPKEGAGVVVVPQNVPSDAGYSTGQSGQDAAKNEPDSPQHSNLHKSSSSMASGREASAREQSSTDNSSSVDVSTSTAAPVDAAATPLHVSRPVPRIPRSVLKKRRLSSDVGGVDPPPSTVKKSVTFSRTGTVLNPYEERDRRVFRETRKKHNESNVLENTLPQQQSTPKEGNNLRKGAKRKCVYDFEEDSSEEEEIAVKTEAATQTDDSFEETVQMIIQQTIRSFKEAEEQSSKSKEDSKSEEDSKSDDSTDRAIQEILQITAASFNVEPKPKKSKRKKKLDRLNSSIEMLIKKVDRLEKGQRRHRSKKPRRLIVKKVVPAKAKPSTDRSSQTEALTTSEVSVETTFELLKPPPKPRATRKRAASKQAKKEDDTEEPEGGPKKKPKRSRSTKKDQEQQQQQQTIVQCLKAEQRPEQIVVEPEIGRMEDGQLVAEDIEDNLSQVAFEIDESLPPMSAPPSPVLRDPRLIKGSHRKPPSIIETQPNSPAPSLLESSSSQGTITNLADNGCDEVVETFNRQIIRLRIDSDSQPALSVKKSQQKPRHQKLQPYPQNPKLRPPALKLVARHIQETIYRGSQDHHSPVKPIDPWKEPLLYPWETCEYLEKHLHQLIVAGKLPPIIETYGDPCWYISLDDSNADLEGHGTYDVPEPEYPQFSQEFSPILPAEGFNHVVNDDDDGILSDSGSVVADES